MELHSSLVVIRCDLSGPFFVIDSRSGEIRGETALVTRVGVAVPRL